MTISYHSHHSPVGADASFTIGKLEARGGFGIELSGPASQDIFIGVQRGNGPFTCFPFYNVIELNRLEDFVVEEGTGYVPPPKAVIHPIPETQITRTVQWATDTWMAPGISLQLLTPFAPLPDPEQAPCAEMRLAYVPAILARLTVDNSDCAEPATACFALAGAPKPLRALADVAPELSGVAFQREWGFATRTQPGVETFIDLAMKEGLAQATPHIHRLGSSGGLRIHLAPGEVKTITLALGFYRSGIVTTGRDTRYFYTSLFENLEQVLAFALEHADELTSIAGERDAELATAALNDEQKFIIAHATRSYYGNTEFLLEGGKPLWVVNEGEYQMMNTFDLTVDMLFYELRQNPWTMRNVLDQFVDRYSYYDQVKHPQEPGAWYPGGLSFCHDMGVFNQFSPPGYSSYELPEMPGCFSHMTHEQLTNWVLCASLYVNQTNDAHWLERRRGIFRECLQSLRNRDGRTPAEYDGVMGMDSSRCGNTGQEITTYDSLDASLGQARNNLYLAGKTWASYVCLEHIFRRLGWDDLAQTAAKSAAMTADTVTGNMLPEGYIPAVFEAGNTSRIIPAIEGLVYPFLMGDIDAISTTGRYGEYIRALMTHLHTVLVPGVCIDETRHWWKMSSTSKNSWFSKVAICQFVARQVLGFDFGEQGLIHDRAHADWQRIGSAEYAMCDQIVDGIGRGSRYYPRGISCILWLEEAQATAALTAEATMQSQ